MSDKFCFYHGTHIENLPFILKDKKIDISSNIEDKHNVRIDWGGVDYVYGNILFKSSKSEGSEVTCGIIISDDILNDQLVIFNSYWAQTPVMLENESNNKLKEIYKMVKNTRDRLDNFSIYLYPSDTQKIRKYKLKIIKTYHDNTINKNCSSFTSHEILFTKPIDVNKYVKKIYLFGIDNTWKGEIYQKAMKIINKIKNKPTIENVQFRHSKNILKKYFNKLHSSQESQHHLSK
jgi:hypothetical protein